MCVSLKSNMDRFIEAFGLMLFMTFLSLKSNMDRFIVRLEESIIRSRRTLKSNMDRFIEIKQLPFYFI